MKLLKNNLWTVLSLALVVVFAMTGTADAVNDIAMNKAGAVFTAARNIMFVVGGFGLITVAFMAITGKMQWKWVGSLAIGLGIIAAASAVITYVTDDSTTKGTITDTFNQ